LELEESLRELTLLRPVSESSSSSENTRRNKKTGKPKKSKCPKGTRRNKKTGKCDPFEKKVKATQDF